jgi:hypothetical protein
LHFALAGSEKAKMPAHMNGMPRRFDAGKDAYAHEHRAHSGQDCRHIIANLTLLKY